MNRVPADSKNLAERVAALLVAGTSLVLAFTCAGSGPVRPGASPRPVRSGAAGGPSVSPAPPPSVTAVPSAAPAQRPFARLDRALTELARGQKTTPVRVLWLGDSHTAADYWPDALRQRLGERFGNGGPGFVRPGVVPYRHAKVQEKTTGRWAKQPNNPARTVPWEDRVLGLGGIRSRPQAREGSTRIELGSGATRGGTRWDLAYRLVDPKARFRVAVDGAPPRPVQADEGATAGLGIQHLELVGSIDGTLELDGFVGLTELMGVTIESLKPGVVVDTVGIDGARAATLLAWDERSWIGEVSRRNPALAVIAFGTNEVVAPDPPRRYGAELGQIVARLRQANAEIDCLLVGPTPLETPDHRTHPRVSEIDRMGAETARLLGCGFFSPFQAMGGEGGYTRWSMESPSLTARDRVHLSPAGYSRLGNLLSDQLLSGLGAVGAP